MGFIAALCTSISAAYLYKKIEPLSMEIAVGVVAIGLVASVVTLIIAPWQVQLLLLLALLWSGVRSSR